MSIKDLQIIPLSPDMANQFTSYLGEMDFSHAEHWHFCFCQYYHVECSGVEWRQRSAEQNKLLAETNIKNGLMRGLVAFDGDQMVGWVNVNDVNNYAQLNKDEELHNLTGRNAIVVCYVIHPDYRRKGLATRMLKEAVEESRRQGFDRIIGKPFIWSAHPQRQYLGVPKMYEELGFHKVSEANGINTYILDLK